MSLGTKHTALLQLIETNPNPTTKDLMHLIESLCDSQDVDWSAGTISDLGFDPEKTKTLEDVEADFNCTALHLACLLGSETVAKQLLAFDADARAKVRIDGTSTLPKESKFDTSQLEGCTPLGISIFAQHNHITALLLKHSPDLTTQIKIDGKTTGLLAYSVHNQDTATIKIMLSHLQQQYLCYTFQDQRLLLMALTEPSFALKHDPALKHALKFLTEPSSTPPQIDISNNRSYIAIGERARNLAIALHEKTQGTSADLADRLEQHMVNIDDVMLKCSRSWNLGAFSLRTDAKSLANVVVSIIGAVFLDLKSCGVSPQQQQQISGFDQFVVWFLGTCLNIPSSNTVQYMSPNIPPNFSVQQQPQQPPQPQQQGPVFLAASFGMPATQQPQPQQPPQQTTMYNPQTGQNVGVATSQGWPATSQPQSFTQQPQTQPQGLQPIYQQPQQPQQQQQQQQAQLQPQPFPMQPISPTHQFSQQQTQQYAPQNFQQPQPQPQPQYQGQVFPPQFAPQQYPPQQYPQQQYPPQQYPQQPPQMPPNPNNQFPYQPQPQPLQPQTYTYTFQPYQSSSSSYPSSPFPNNNISLPPQQQQQNREDAENPVSELQALCQRVNNGRLPEYDVLATEGPAHKPTFRMRVRTNLLGIVADGTGSTKKIAKAAAAKIAFDQLKQIYPV